MHIDLKKKYTMKYIVVALVTLMLFLSPSDGAEYVVLRVFEPYLKMTNEDLQEILKKANLENYGFQKTMEALTETDEHGQTRTKKTLDYFATDDCSKVVFWQNRLEQRLPDTFKSSGIAKSTVKKVQSRIAGRRTKFCKFGLEIHMIMVAKESIVKKQSVSTDQPAASPMIWTHCFKATIMFDPEHPEQHLPYSFWKRYHGLIN